MPRFADFTTHARLHVTRLRALPRLRTPHVAGYTCSCGYTALPYRSRLRGLPFTTFYAFHVWFTVLTTSLRTFYLVCYTLHRFTRFAFIRPRVYIRFAVYAGWFVPGCVLTYGLRLTFSPDMVCWITGSFFTFIRCTRFAAFCVTVVTHCGARFAVFCGTLHYLYTRTALDTHALHIYLSTFTRSHILALRVRLPHTTLYGLHGLRLRCTWFAGTFTRTCLLRFTTRDTRTVAAYTLRPHPTDTLPAHFTRFVLRWFTVAHVRGYGLLPGLLLPSTPALPRYAVTCCHWLYTVLVYGSGCSDSVPVWHLWLWFVYTHLPYILYHTLFIHKLYTLLYIHTHHFVDPFHLLYSFIFCYSFHLFICYITFIVHCTTYTFVTHLFIYLLHCC